MRIELEPDQSQAQEEFRALVDHAIGPKANAFDEQGCIPDETLNLLRQKGLFGANISRQFGGTDLGPIKIGLLCEQMGRGSCSLLSLLVVHGMVAHAIAKWGSDEQRKQWLPKLAAGEVFGAFALSEPNVGSDAKRVETEAVRSENRFIINGRKKWISFGGRAHLFLVFVRCQHHGAALLVERESPGLTISPISGMLGFRAAQLACLDFKDCAVPESHLVAKVGFGFSHVAGAGLDYGRFCVGWGGVGLAQACLDASLDYASKRKQFDKPLKEHQLVQEMLANMMVGVKAGRMLCYHASYLRQEASPEMILETASAKYFASQVAVRAAASAVQIHGANGFSPDYPVQRYFRDAKVLEIIEGTNQMHQMMIARYGG